MTVEVYMGSPASGKTEKLFQAISLSMKTVGYQQVWMLLPNMPQAQASRNRLQETGKMLGVFTGTFQHLCEQLLISQSIVLAKAHPVLKQRVLNKIINEADSKNQLDHFSEIRNTPGFMNMLFEHFQELQQAGVTPREAQLQEWASNNDNLGVILALYAAYLKELEHAGWQDADFLVKKTIEWVDHTALPEIALLVVDGFERFTPPQLELIALLSRKIPRIMITLSGNSTSQRIVHRRFLNTLSQIKTYLPDADVYDLDQPARLPPALAYLEKNLMEPVSGNQPDDGSIKMLSLQSPAEEVREALRWIKKKWQMQLANPPKTALLVPDENTYFPFIKATAAEYGLPVHFTVYEKLGDQPEINSILELLELAGKDYPRRSLIDLVRTPFFDFSCFGFHAEDSVRLEQVSYSGPVIGGLDQWQSVLDRLKNEQEKTEDLGEDEISVSLPTVTQAQRLSAALSKMAERLNPLKALHPMSFWVEWLANLLQDLFWIEKKTESNQESLAEALKNVLDGLRLGEMEMGEWLVPYESFVKELQTLLQNTRCDRNQQGTETAISVMRIPEARGLRFDDVVITGLAEGVFPAVERADPFFSEEFRLAFGLQPRLSQDQASFFYQAVTRADRSLLLTRPYLSNKGEGLEPSPFWNAVVECFGSLCAETFRPTDERKLSDAASKQELFFWTARQGYSFLNEPDMQSEWQIIKEQQNILDARLAKQARGKFEGWLEVLPESLGNLQANGAEWSSSRLETYIHCPMQYWTRHGLAVEELITPQPGLQSNQLGSLLHKILEDVYQSADDPSDPQSVLAALPSVAEQNFAEAPQRFEFVPNTLWQIQQQEYLKMIENTILELADAEWVPHAYEQKFGIDDTPFLVLQIDETHTIKVRGLVDRIDKNERGELRVIDYKTGQSHLSEKDLQVGTRLQLPLYAMAVRDALHLGEPVEGFYFAIKAGEKSAIKLSKFQFEDFKGPQGAMDVVLEHVRTVIAGIQAADFHPDPPDDGCPSYCPARLWCWRYKPGRRFS